jgi:hypothetical protein
MVVYDASPKGQGLILKLQRPAMRALLAAQVRYAKRSGWTKARIDKTKVRVGGKVYLEGRPIVMTPGTNRTCSTQAALYRSDSSRYARPEITGHTRGLALDVSTAQPNQAVIRSCLKMEGWKQVRPDDEIWHHSFGYTI